MFALGGRSRGTCFDRATSTHGDEALPSPPNQNEGPETAGGERLVTAGAPSSSHGSQPSTCDYSWRGTLIMSEPSGVVVVVVIVVVVVDVIIVVVVVVVILVFVVVVDALSSKRN